MDIKRVLQDNLLSLLRKEAGGELPGSESGVSRLARIAGKKTSFGQRLLDDTDSSLSSLAEAARAFRLEPWQLLVPNLDPENPPAIAEDPNAWPFSRVDREEYLSLPHDDRVWVQSKMDSAVKEQLEFMKKRRRA